MQYVPFRCPNSSTRDESYNLPHLHPDRTAATFSARPSTSSHARSTCDDHVARPNRLYSLFARMLDGSETERAEILAQISSESPTLAVELADLLRSHDGAPASFLRYGTMAEPSVTDDSNQFGAYRIVGELGRGGMGIVFDAEQEEPRRRVALKVVPSGASLQPLLVQRFQREAKVLGRLQHRGIAQIYEAGTAQVGLATWPYFAMERIDGELLDDWLSHRPSLESKLSLFIEICDAIHHAHEHHVVHRDIKPSNIMVVRGDTPGSFHPKVLDFGVALTVDGQGTSPTFVTQSGQVIGTVAYMSPEQMAGDSKAVNARTDVYALGVILYWLLTDTLPLPVRDRPLHEAVRIVQTEEPIRLRSVDPSISSELDNIVQRALEKNPDRRYSTAASLADDVRRFLRHEPVTARPPSTWYLAAKFAQRNQHLVAGIVATFVALVFGLATTTTAFFEAARERDRAQNALRASRAMADYLTEVLASGDPWSNSADLKVRDIIEPAAASISTRFRDQPLIEARLHTTIGRVYAGLGLFSQSVHHFELALKQFSDLETTAASDRIIAISNLGQSLLKLKRTDDAKAVLEGGFSLLEPQFDQDDPQLLPILTVLIALKLKSGVDSSTLTLIENAERRASFYEDLSQPYVVELLVNRSSYHRRRAESHLAYPYLNKLYRTIKDGHGIKYSSTKLGVAAEQLGSTSRTLGRTEEALALHQEGYNLLLQELGPAHNFTVDTASQYARTLAKAGRAEEGLKLLNEVRKLAEAAAKEQGTPFVLPTILEYTQARILAQIPERREQAERALRAVIRRCRSESGEMAGLTQMTRQALVTFLLRDHRFKEAINEVDILLPHLRTKYAPGTPRLEEVIKHRATAVAGLRRSASPSSLAKALN